MRRTLLYAVIASAGALVAVALAAAPSAAWAGPSAASRPVAGADVLKVATDIPDGGGYNKTWAGSGTPAEVTFDGQRVLPRGTGGTYCSGFTFAVAMAVAERRGLLAGKTLGQ